MSEKPSRALAPVVLLATMIVVIASSPTTAASRPARDGHAAAAKTGPTKVPATKTGPTVLSALSTLYKSGAITTAVYDHDRSEDLAAEASVERLTGTRHEELSAVLANVAAVAADGGFIASRLPALFLTLSENRSWWTTGPLLSVDQRVSIPGSEIVWEHYPGQGIEIQWLATFGEANGYYISGDHNQQLEKLLNEVIPLATDRAGGIAWEYMFRFDGGVPPWTSGLSQGTAIQALSRAWSRLHDASYLAAAEKALGIFQQPPPVGVRVTTPQGAWYAEYTYAPTDRILNGFIQSLVGLYEFAHLTKSSLGLSLFEAGDATARVQTPNYNTGYWSMYDQHTESDLNYHELLAEFLKDLCQRTERGPPVTITPPPPTTTPTTPTTGTTGTTTTGGTTTATGGTTTGGATTTTTTSTSTSTSTTTTTTSTTTPPATTLTTPIPGDQIYCTTSAEFTEDLRQPPKVSLLSHDLKGGVRAGVQVSLSKISTVHLTIRDGSHVVWTNAAEVEGGKPKLLWVTPASGGTYTATISATDLASETVTTTGAIKVSPARSAAAAGR